MIRGWSTGADCVVLGAARPELATLLAQACPGSEARGCADLAALAGSAAGEGPLVLAAADLDLDLPATLDLLDVPTDRTAVLLADPRNIEAPRQHAYGLEHASLARVSGDRTVESVGSIPEAGGPGIAYAVGNPNRVVVGLMRIRAADRPRAAELWRSAAQRIRPDSGDPFDLALLALVRGGLPITEQPLGYYRWSRAGVGQDGLGATGWDQRLRSASRLGDGAYSTTVIRRLSRLGTRIALRTPLTPNAITAISLAVGIVAAVLIFTGPLIFIGRPVAWIIAAVLLQLALIIDCVDGEVARYTRRYSAFGGWLDGIGDRIKEYLIFAAVGAAAVRDQHPAGWLLAMIAMVVVTARHLEDYAYTDRQVPDQIGKPVTLPLDQLDDGSPSRSRTELAREPSVGARISFWARKIAHVPIGERYLVLSLALLTLRPLWVLIAAIAVSGFGLVWTVGGRLLRALRRRRSYRTPTLDHQLDLGLLALLAGRITIPYLAAVLIMIISWLGLIASIVLDRPLIASAWAVLSVIMTGCALRQAQGSVGQAQGSVGQAQGSVGQAQGSVGQAQGSVGQAQGSVGQAQGSRVGWLALPLVWIGEAAVIGSLLARGIGGALIFATLAAIAYRRYELIYSIRLRGVWGPRSLLGAEGRMLVTAVLFTVGTLNRNPGVIDWGLVALAVETMGEAVLGTAIRWRRPERSEHTR